MGSRPGFGTHFLRITASNAFACRKLQHAVQERTRSLAWSPICGIFSRPHSTGPPMTPHQDPAPVCSMIPSALLCNSSETHASRWVEACRGAHGCHEGSERGTVPLCATLAGLARAAAHSLGAVIARTSKVVLCRHRQHAAAGCWEGRHMATSVSCAAVCFAGTTQGQLEERVLAVSAS